MGPSSAIALLWIGWALSWVIAAGWSRRTQRRPPRGAAVGYRVLHLIGALLMFAWLRGGPQLRLWELGRGGAWICTAVVAAGIVFTWWARICLGELWSASITRKEGHRLVDTGPYAIVRHPIYAGMLLALLATAAAEGTVPGAVGFVLLAAGLWIKARQEEQWLAAQLGRQAYADYRTRVPMLVPAGPRLRGR